jgi:hypothetical protein
MVSNLGKENRRVKNNPSRHRHRYGAIRARGTLASAEHYIHAVTTEFTDHAALRALCPSHDDVAR